jgi:hypothetical protein
MASLACGIAKPVDWPVYCGVGFAAGRYSKF